MKKVLLLLLMLFVAFNVSEAKPKKLTSTISYEFNNGTLDIYGTGKMPDYEYNRAPFKKFADDIRKVVIHEGITRIGSNTFYTKYRYGVREVIIPSTLKEIGYHAFYYTKLQKINIDHPIKIEEWAFSNCELLKVIIPKGSVVEQGAFSGCENLKHIEYYASRIPDWCFSEAKIEYLILDDNIESIGSRAFWDATFEDAEDFEFPKNLKKIGTEAFSVTAFIGLRKLVLPPNLTSIEDEAFSHAFFNELEEIIYPENLRRIEKKAFYHAKMPKLKQMLFPESVSYIGEKAFKDVFPERSSITLSIPEYCKLGEYSFSVGGYRGSFDNHELIEEINAIKLPVFLTEYKTQLYYYGFSYGVIRNYMEAYKPDLNKKFWEAYNREAESKRRASSSSGSSSTSKSESKSDNPCGACKGSGKTYFYAGTQVTWMYCSSCSGTGKSGGSITFDPSKSYPEFNGYTGGYVDIDNSNSYNSGGSNNSNNRQQSTTKAYCPYCNGKGRKAVNQGTTMMGTNDSKVYCSECGSYFLRSSGHGHIQCGHCGGTGKMR